MRCPEEKGGCGAVVEFLFDSGLCASCDGLKAKGKLPAPKKKTAVTTGVLVSPPAAAATPPGPRKPRGKPFQKNPATARGPRGPYKKKTTPAAAAQPRRKYVRRKPSESGDDDLSVLARLRAQFDGERAEGAAMVARMDAKLEVLDDLEQAIRALK